MKRIYLSGPMSGLTERAAADWRRFVTLDLQEMGMHAINPMRGERFAPGPITSAKSAFKSCSHYDVTARDLHDVQKADAVLINLAGSQEVSIGTIMELAWAYQARVPVVVVTGIGDVGKRIAEHTMVKACAGWIVEDMADAEGVLATLFE